MSQVVNVGLIGYGTAGQAFHAPNINVIPTIVNKEELMVKPEEARNNIRIIELAMQSNSKKQTLEFYHK